MYIDPNTGGMLFQVLLVVFTFFTGILLVFSGKIRAGIGRLRRRFRRKEDAESDQQEPRS